MNRLLAAIVAFLFFGPAGWREVWNSPGKGKSDG